MKYSDIPLTWVAPVKRGFKFCCCDCGLVHKLNFRVIARRVQFKAVRDNRATGQVRRHRKIKIKETK